MVTALGGCTAEHGPTPSMTCTPWTLRTDAGSGPTRGRVICEHPRVAPGPTPTVVDRPTRYGWDDRWAARFDSWVASDAAAEVVDPQPGRVVRHDGAGLVVATADGPTRAMFGPPVDPPPVVGDWVVVDRTPTPIATLPRDSLLRRRAAGGEREQALVANVDVVLAVCGLDRPVRKGRIQRTVAIAIDAGRRDRGGAHQGRQGRPRGARRSRADRPRGRPRLPVVTLSAKGGWGIDDLLEHVGRRTVALIGESGAGKSTLVNALMANEVAEEGAVRAGDAKGRHTTTHRELHVLATAAASSSTPRASARWGSGPTPTR
jgi:ribosome biogenesis GTPase / thiamine phosphate phosphatase